MIKLRITPDGRIRGLWSDEVQLCELGVVRVRRASHVGIRRPEAMLVRPRRVAKDMAQPLAELVAQATCRLRSASSCHASFGACLGAQAL